MPGLFGMGVPATVAMTVVALLVVLVVALPAGRDAVAVIAGQMARWPGRIRAELRGAAPLGVDGVGPGADTEVLDAVGAPGAGVRPVRRNVGETTPDIPVVTRGLPVVERPDRR
ncbi:hypothetical protein [Pseudonocardia endophytica]|uniref:Uncharacterized protein n=1 Tax=Pseudonocardia endophytica TaxID=401976 RepID=A0A4R1HW92_PSEEN|nr:hypothetical protein [Pseudonocardia endophytica]TCK26598.1 hypothetical protein EV378_2436 [Pseudonocardia endophytica]